jgi:transposase
MNGLSKYYIRKIINCFSTELTATETSKKLKINRNTVNKYYRIIRGAIVNYQEIQQQIQSDSNTSKKYYFSWHKNRGLIPDLQEGYPAFSLLIKNGRVYVQKQATKKLLEQLRNNEIEEPGEFNFGNYLLNTGLPPMPAHNSMSRGLAKTDIPSNYFVYAKEKLTKFYGVKEEYTYMYLKELEFRFNNQGKDLSKLLWKILPHHSAEWVRTSRHRR